MKIILASQSPRRIEMMESFGFPFEVVPSHKNEIVESFTSEEDIVMQLAKMKAMDIFEKNPDALVLGFDTLVFLDGKALGKPHSEEECIQMVMSLKNRYHKVITGGFIVAKDYSESFYSTCNVHIMDIPTDEIYEYAKTKEPYDKAGAYAVQGYVGRFIDKVDGDVFSVIGMPKAKVYNLLSHYMQKH